jgi:uncharacterized membrane protein YhaH (DUF805 family)
MAPSFGLSDQHRDATLAAQWCAHPAKTRVRAIAAAPDGADDHAMVFLWIGVSFIAIAIAVTSIVDVVRRRPSGVAMVGWICLIVILPFIGSIIYWATRPTSRREVEQAYLAQRDERR